MLGIGGLELRDGRARGVQEAEEKGHSLLTRLRQRRFVWASMAGQPYHMADGK